jgi:hypothetical protein
VAKIEEVAKDSYGFDIVIPVGRDASGFTTKTIYYLKPDRTTVGSIADGAISIVTGEDGIVNGSYKFTAATGLLNQRGQFLFWPHATDGSTYVLEGRQAARLQVSDRN